MTFEHDIPKVLTQEIPYSLTYLLRGLIKEKSHPAEHKQKHKVSYFFPKRKIMKKSINRPFLTIPTCKRIFLPFIDSVGLKFFF